jgi:hypothetical protein
LGLLPCPHATARETLNGFARKPTLENFTHYVGFEVITAVVMKSTIFWDMTTCSPLKVNRSERHLLSRWFLDGLIILRP